MSKQSTRNGFAVLYIALIVASITAVLSVVAATSSVHGIKTLRLVENRSEVAVLLTSCTDVVLLQVRFEPEADMQGSFNLHDGSCRYSVQGDIPSKAVTVAATKDTLEMEHTLYITETTPVLVY